MEKRERAEARNKKQRRPILLKEKHENFIAAAMRKWEMLAATKMKMSVSGKKSEQRHIQHTFPP